MRNNYICLVSTGVKPVGFSDWEKIDGVEMSKGEAIGKPREKLLTVQEMLQVAHKWSQGSTYRWIRTLAWDVPINPTVVALWNTCQYCTQPKIIHFWSWSILLYITAMHSMPFILVLCPSLCGIKVTLIQAWNTHHRFLDYQFCLIVPEVIVLILKHASRTFKLYNGSRFQRPLWVGLPFIIGLPIIWSNGTSQITIKSVFWNQSFQMSG